MRTIHRDIVGPFIFSSDHKILVGKAGVYKGEWVIPGGGVEPGETRLEALRRETLEETGIDLKGAKVEEVPWGAITGSSEKTLRDTDERVHVEMKFYNYLVQLDELASKIKLSEEDDFSEATWFSMQALAKEKVSAPTVETLTKLGLWPQ